MKKNPLFVAVSNQKGGVGKSTMLVTLASLLNYSMGKNVAIGDVAGLYGAAAGGGDNL